MLLVLLESFPRTERIIFRHELLGNLPRLRKLFLANHMDWLVINIVFENGIKDEECRQDNQEPSDKL